MNLIYRFFKWVDRQDHLPVSDTMSDFYEWMSEDCKNDPSRPDLEDFQDFIFYMEYRRLFK